jgi:hypothetical protein
MPSQALVPGSLGAVAKQNNMSIAESFLSVDALVVVDTSGSMGAMDAPGGQERYQAACSELRNLQATLPGKIGVISFSDSPVFCPGGVPHFLGAGTNLASALRFVHAADGLDIRFIVVSDGAPDSPEDALKAARQFKSKIDVIYVGPENGHGARFLAQLAAATGGQQVTADRVANLSTTVQHLLTTRA